MNDFYTVKEAAALLGISPSTVMARIRRGHYKAQRKGWSWFIHKDELQGDLNKDMEGSAR